VKKTVRILLVSVVALGFAANSGAFVRDTHYYLTFGLALATCFEWAEAHLIASADVMTDQNKTTKAETSLIKKHKKRTWHAFGHPEDQLNALWVRVLEEQDRDIQLIHFGQFLHFVQDWEAHAGYPLSRGHAVATITGKDPDSLAKSETRTDNMVQATLDHMFRLCGALDRLPAGVDDPDLALLDRVFEVDEDPLIDDLIQSSNPKWRIKWLGGLTKKGRRIVAQNRQRTEEFIDRSVRKDPAKTVPDDFRPGDDEFGIPDPIPLRFDVEGRLVSDLDRSIARAHELDEKDLERGNDQLVLERAREVEGGWEVRVAIRNSGDTSVPEGRIRFMVSDVLAEEQLGEISKPVPPLDPEERVEVEALIRTSRVSEQVLISVVADVDDLSALNNELWFMTKDDLRELEEERTAVDHPDVETVEFVADPKLWLSADDEICLVVTARTNLVDPTIDFAPPTIELAHEGVEPVVLVGSYPRVWSISADESGGRPMAKTFACFSAREEICPGIERAARSLALEVTLVADEVEKRVSIPLDDERVARLLASCDGATAD
jgi:hypothetical protein